jgi:hypothetical protein
MVPGADRSEAESHGDFTAGVSPLYFKRSDDGVGAGVDAGAPALREYVGPYSG